MERNQKEGQEINKMMTFYKDNIEDVDNGCYKPKRSKRIDKPISDTIYVFDIETTSLFNINGKYQTFDFSKEPSFYDGVDKVSLCYIWMFGIEDQVYYGRELRDFEEVLLSISSPDCYKVIWCHNLSYEMCFLMSIFEDKYTITDVCARSIKKPIEFRIKELNIIFRCSYMLTNLSLASAGKEYTKLEKKVGDLDYNKVRSPLTKMTKKELGYCEYDIRVVTEIIRYYLREYNHMYSIPLTSTGTVRKALKEHVDIWYIKHQQELVPNRHIYLLLWQCFAGGFTHANMLHSNKVFHEDIESEDEASEYPAKMVTEMFPCGEFMKCDASQYDDTFNRSCYAFLFVVELTNVKSKYYTHFMQSSKCYEYYEWLKKECTADVLIDNGRIQKVDKATLVLTDVDFEILKKNYTMDVKILECYKAKKDYLDVRVIKFILGLYGNKTTLKGIEDEQTKTIYRRDKGRLNSCYGFSVTNPLKQSAMFSNEVWSVATFTDSFVDSKLEDMRHSFSTLMYFACGCWVTAYARRDLARIIFSSRKMDRDVIYCDTDSLKFRNREQHQDIFLSYNNEMIEKYKSVCERYDELELKDFMPADTKGVLHPIGFFEFDGLYQDTKGDGSFKTLGAKKYCYRENGELHITVAGVSKKGVTALKDNMNNFVKGMKWGYDTSGKQTHFYREKHLVNGAIVDDCMSPFTFEDIDGNVYTSNYRWGIVLMPTTYTLGLTDEYEAILEMCLDAERRRK